MKKPLSLALLFMPLAWANKQVTIDIKQMTCSLCVISVNQALRATGGVIKVKSSLKTRQAVAFVRMILITRSCLPPSLKPATATSTT
jgi:mercuric ion binding protein